jgi:hypothetical protein
MSNFKDIEYWKRRIKANTMPLAPGDTKLMLGAIIQMNENLAKQVEALNETIQSMGPKRTPRSSKKLDSSSTPEGDSSGNA